MRVLVALFLALAGCGPDTPACAELRRRIERCDSREGAAAMRCWSVPSAIEACADLDMRGPDACNRFMGCLYDGP